VEQPLFGGNTNERVVRLGDTVRRPAGPWTPAIHAVLAHLAEQGYRGAPRAHGLDEQGREILDYIEGEVVWPDHFDLVESDAALAGVVASIRGFHDAAATFSGVERFTWSDRGADPRGPREILCHNDLAPWNLIHVQPGSWAFIDWDLAAPGRCSWDLAWALLSFVPLMPENDPGDQRVVERIRLFRDTYGAAEFPTDVLAVAVERCEHKAERIDRLGAAGEEPYARLLAEGHGQLWHAATAHIAAHARTWQPAFTE
jgi:hypothetical protein